MNASNAYNPVPLTWRDLPDALSRWVESLRCDRFWVMLLDNVKASERVRDAAMKAVVWLEMKGFPKEAQRLDDAVQSMREAVFSCRQAMAAYGPSKAKDVSEVHQLRDAWVAAVENLRIVVEQVLSDVPSEVWEGIDG